MTDIGTIPNGDTSLIISTMTTPPVASGIRFAVLAPITITNFTNATPGQIIIVLAGADITIANGPAIALAGGVNFDMAYGDVVLLQQGAVGPQTGHLLEEGGGYLLLEDGGRIILEGLPAPSGVWTELCRCKVGVVSFAQNVYGLLVVYQPWDTAYPAVLAFPGGIFGEESGWVAGGIDFQRAYNGNANSLTAFLKRRKVFKWEYLTPDKIADLEALWQFGGQFAFGDAIDLDNGFTGIMLAEPKFQQDFHKIWSGGVEVQQI